MCYSPNSSWYEDIWIPSLLGALITINWYKWSPCQPWSTHDLSLVRAGSLSWHHWYILIAVYVISSYSTHAISIKKVLPSMLCRVCIYNIPSSFLLQLLPGVRIHHHKIDHKTSYYTYICTYSPYKGLAKFWSLLSMFSIWQLYLFCFFFCCYLCHNSETIYTRSFIFYTKMYLSTFYVEMDYYIMITCIEKWEPYLFLPYLAYRPKSAYAVRSCWWYMPLVCTYIPHICPWKIWHIYAV